MSVGVESLAVDDHEILQLGSMFVGFLNTDAFVPPQALARTLTVALIVSGVAVLAYMQSSLTALFVEDVIGHALRRRRSAGTWPYRGHGR